MYIFGILKNSCFKILNLQIIILDLKKYFHMI
jgi:hypothetical protein